MTPAPTLLSNERVTHIVGARPNFPKAVPVIAALCARAVAQRLVHTGQHYDDARSAQAGHQPWRRIWIACVADRRPIAGTRRPLPSLGKPQSCARAGPTARTKFDAFLLIANVAATLPKCSKGRGYGRDMGNRHNCRARSESLGRTALQTPVDEVLWPRSYRGYSCSCTSTNRFAVAGHPHSPSAVATSRMPASPIHPTRRAGTPATSA